LNGCSGFFLELSFIWESTHLFRGHECWMAGRVLRTGEVLLGYGSISGERGGGADAVNACFGICITSPMRIRGINGMGDAWELSGLNGLITHL
jgi:hypothetical protein